MHDLLIWTVVGLYGAAALNLMLGERALRRFAREVPVLSSDREMTLFRKLAARQMYAALAQIALLGLATVLLFVGFGLDLLRLDDLRFVLIPAGALVLLSLLARKVERQVQETPTATASLAAERDTVVATWLKKPLPDW